VYFLKGFRSAVTQNGEKVDFRNDNILRIRKDAPMTFFVKWSHNDIELFKSVNLNKVKKGRPSCFAKEGLSLMDVQPQQKYSTQHAIKSNNIEMCRVSYHLFPLHIIISTTIFHMEIPIPFQRFKAIL
jgi:hypothetical protein